MSSLNQILRNAVKGHIKSYIESNINDLADQAAEKFFDNGEVEEIDEVVVEYLQEQMGDIVGDSEVHKEIDEVLQNM